MLYHKIYICKCLTGAWRRRITHYCPILQKHHKLSVMFGLSKNLAAFCFFLCLNTHVTSQKHTKWQNLSLAAYQKTKIIVWVIDCFSYFVRKKIHFGLWETTMMISNIFEFIYKMINCENNNINNELSNWWQIFPWIYTVWWLWLCFCRFPVRARRLW